MKTRYLLLLCLFSTCLFSCQKEELKPIREKGSLHIDIGLFIHVYEVNGRLKSTQLTEDFKVSVYRADGSVVMEFERAAEIPEEIELEAGDYYVVAHSDNNLPAEFENPYYYGESDVFTIIGNMQQSVLVNCELANTMVTIVYSDRVRNSFSDYTTTVESALGSLVFSRDETRAGYFQPMPLSITVLLTWQKPDGSMESKTLSGNIPDPLAKRHYEIHVDASIDEGMASFQIMVDEMDVPVEIVEITDEVDQAPSGAIGYGDLLITEIMYDPAALSDTEGEWFEIYNNTDHSINLQHLVLQRDDVNSHIIADPIEILPGTFFILARTELASDASSYIYGSGISLTNTGAVLSIYNAGTEGNTGQLIFSVDYGSENFPDCPGASIGLSPDSFNAVDAEMGTSWCCSTSTYNTGDLGTPGLTNDICVQ